MRKEVVFNKCLEVIREFHHSGDCAKYILDKIDADGLSLYEAKLVASCVGYYLTEDESWLKGETETIHDVVSSVKAIVVSPDSTAKYEFINCIDYDANNERFNAFFKNILAGEALDVVYIMSEGLKSNLKPYSYGEILAGNANNFGERIVYDNFMWIITASYNTITLFKRIL